MILNSQAYNETQRWPEVLTWSFLQSKQSNLRWINVVNIVLTTDYVATDSVSTIVVLVEYCYTAISISKTI